MAARYLPYLSGFLCVTLVAKIIELCLAARRDQRTIILIVSLASFTVAAMAGIPAVRKHIPFENIPGVASITMDTGVSVSLALLAFHLWHPLRSGRTIPWWRSGLFLSACAVSAFLAVLMATTPPEHRTNPLQNQYTGEWSIVCVYVIGNLFFLYCSGSAALACLRIGRIVRGPLTVALRVGAIGMTAYAVTCVNRLVLVVAQLVGGEIFNWYSAVNFVFTEAAVLASVLGLHFTTLRWVLMPARRYVNDLRTFRRLGPLWRLLTTSCPQVVLPPERGVHGLWDRIDVPYRKYRRVIECQDALLLLGTCPPDAEDGLLCSLSSENLAGARSKGGENAHR